MSERTLSVLDGSTFVLGDRLGDLRPDAGREHGFFSEDTRFVSRWVLRVDDTPLELLSVNQSAHFDAQFFLTPTVGPEEEAPCSIVRDRLVGDVWMERVIVTNHLHETGRLRLALDVDTDFADLFEIKDGLVAERDVVCQLDDAHGHLLWSGILDDREAAVTAERLLSEELYSGWGVRTLATCEAGYNPLGYHTGTVWPHDNSMIAAGLARYGHDEAAATIASSILAAAPYFEHRLPEVFTGFPPTLTSVPVAFPTASRPQAWAAGAPLLMLTTLLHLRPERTDIQADLPDTIGHVAIRRHPDHSPLPPAITTV